MELIAPFLNSLRHRRADAAALVAQQAQQAHRRASQCDGRVEIGGDVHRRETASTAQGSSRPAARPPARTDVEIHLRHPVVADRPSTNRPAPINHRASVLRPSMKPTTGIAITAKNPAGDITSPAFDGVVTEQGLQQARQGRAGGVEHRVGAKDDDAAWLKLRSANGRKLTTGLGLRNSQIDQTGQTPP